MRRFSKTLSLVLTLAIVLSVFGMFSAFVSAADTLPTGVSQKYVMDDSTSKTMSNTAYTSAGKATAGTTWYRQTDANGDYYWTMTFRESAVTSSGPWTSTWTGSSSNLWVLRDATDDTSTYDDKKNTNYVVYDLDVSTDGMHLDGLTFNVRTNVGGATGANNFSAGAFGFDINFNGTEVSSVSGKTTASNHAHNGGKWTHVTVVYDYTGQDPANWKAHAYINGEFAGTIIDGMEESHKTYEYETASVWWVRLSPLAGTSAAQTALMGKNQETNISNLTIRHFDNTYTGNLTTDGVLANSDIRLDEIPELAYCMENLPADAKVAELTRGDETEEIFSFDRLDASLKDGDTVKLFRSLEHPILVPTGATISWDNNGYAKADPVEFDLDSYDYVIRDKNWDVSTQGSQVYDEATLTNDSNPTVTTDNLKTDIGTVSATKIVTLLSERVITNASHSVNTSGASLILDLNGNTIVHDTDSGKLFNTSANRTGVIVKNGSYDYDHDGDAYAMPNTREGVFFIFKNMDKIDLTGARKEGTLFDQRAGTVAFNDCRDIYCHNKNLTNLKGGTSSHSRLYVISSTVSGTASNLVPCSNVLTSSVYAYGSFDIGVTVKDSTITSAGKFMSVEAYGNSYCQFDSDANAVVTDGNGKPLSSLTRGDDNINKCRVDISGSTIKTSVNEAAVQIQLQKITNTNYDVDGDGTKDTVWPESFYFATDVNVKGSKFTTGNLVRQVDYDETALPEGFDYTYDVTIDVEGASEISAKRGVVRKDGAGGDIGVTIADGVKLANTFVYHPEHSVGEYTLGTGSSVVAYSSLDTADAETNDPLCDCVVTPTYDTYTYQLGTQDAETFYWNKADGEEFDIDRVVTLAEATDLYYYDWDIDGNAYTSHLYKSFKFGVNLTLREDININMFLPLAATPDAIDLKIDGVAAEYEVYGEQNKVVIKGIDPTKADIPYTITGAVNGAYGDSVAINGTVSIVGYLDNALNDGVTDGDELLQAVLNYVVAAGVYKDEPVDLTGTSIAATPIPEPAYGVEKAPEIGGAITGVELVLDGGFKWKISTTATSAKATYTVNGVAKENADVAVTNGTIVLNLKAMDLTSDVTITAGESTVTFNYAWYAAGQDAENDALQTLIAATWAYATASAAYSN